MKHTRILFLIALVAGLGLMPGWESTSAAQSCQQEGACFASSLRATSPIPARARQPSPSVLQTNAGTRYLMWPSVPAALPAWRPLTGAAITATSAYTMSPGRGAGGTPGFESVKFTPTLKNFANSASEIFNVVVSNFNPATMVMVRAKAGNAQETYNFLLSQTCGMPTPTRRIYWGNGLEPTRSAGPIRRRKT